MRLSTRKFSLISIVAVLITGNCSTAISLGKPMAKPTTQEALGCDWIVEAEYVDFARPLFEPADTKDNNQTPKIVSFVRTSEFDYFEPPHAEYRVYKILKEPKDNISRQMKTGDLIRVPFHFHDLSARLAPAEWKFRRSLLPKDHSHWILYLKPANEHFGPTEYETYRGEFGRVPATPANLALLSNNLRTDKIDSNVQEK